MLLIVIVACVSLSCIEYIGKDDGYYLILEFLKKHGFAALSDKISFYIKSQVNNQLFSLAYWVFIILIFYIGLPLLLIKFVFKEKLSNYGFAVGNLFKDYKIYLLFFGFMVPIIIFFSTTDSFQSRYPFYRLSGNETLWPNFWTWQILYFFQFIAVEFFFRGFLVHGLKKQFGYYSILIMTIPYCMIHFGKPFPETIAAIIAGIVLGTLSLKSRTILMGVAIHYTVALSMDLSALWQKGYLLH
ncbi:MAG: CPBP family intramembrane glutamic endopeptidase [Bacteroidota bacterium]